MTPPSPQASPSPGPALPRRPRPPGVARVAEALEERLDRIVGSTLDTIMAEVPVYGDRGAPVADDTRRAAAYVYASFLEMLRTGRAPGEPVARSLATVGADRAAQGIPLGDLLQAFRISGRVIAGALNDAVAERDLDRDAALWVAEAIVLWVDVVSNLAARDHSRAQARILQESEERRRGFLLDVLYGGLSGEDAVERADEVGWDRAPPQWVAVLGRDDGRDVDRAVEEEITGDLGAGFAALTHGDLVLVVPAPTSADVDTLEGLVTQRTTKAGLHLGLTLPQSGVDGVRRAFLEATEALTIARATGEAVVHFGAAVLDRLLRRDPELLSELVTSTLNTVLAYDRSRNTELVHTLETYFACGESPTRTAEVLHTHPQTVRYRLTRVNEIVGLSLDDPDDRLQILLALRGRRLLPRRKPQAAGPVL